MAYTRVYRVDVESLIEDHSGETFIRKEKLEEMLQKRREYSLLYFHKYSRNSILTNFPADGSRWITTYHSEVKGPFESPHAEDDEENEEVGVEDIIRTFPVSGALPQWNQVVYREYGTREEKVFTRHLAQHYHNDINIQLLKTIGREALQTIEQMGGTVIEDDERRSVYSELVEEMVISFEYSEEPPYPRLQLSVFGNEQDTLQMIQRLKLRRLTAAFSTRRSRELGLHSLTRQGFSYDLPLEEVNLEGMEEEERIIL